MAPLTNLLSFLPLLSRSSQAKPSPYLTVTTEQQAPCRTYADGMHAPVHSFGSGVKLNVSCWTISTMQDSKGKLNDDGDSFLWLWVQLNGTWGEPGFQARPGVGNLDQGGKAGGDGCWLHEDSVQEGTSTDFEEALQYCGKAPHHQIASSKYNTALICRNCTDLSNTTCQTQYDTQSYGYVDVGCWKKGTAVGGNTTWVEVIEPPQVNCYVSPDQWDPKEWHGLPEGQCKS